MKRRVIPWQGVLLGLVAVSCLIGESWGGEPMAAQVQWDKQSYQMTDAAVIEVTDSDQNQNPIQIETVSVAVWSDLDNVGFNLFLMETGLSTGVFRGTVVFTSNQSSGNSLQAANGDTVTAEFPDPIIPVPLDPTTFFSADITGTAIIGTIVPPLERAPAANKKVVDAYGKPLDDVTPTKTIQPWYLPPLDDVTTTETVQPWYLPPPKPPAEADVETDAIKTIQRR